jgi:hypothetical protein
MMPPSSRPRQLPLFNWANQSILTRHRKGRRGYLTVKGYRYDGCEVGIFSGEKME